MNQTPLISIIVPVYNVAPYLPRCLDSIMGQTYQNLEIVLVDDGSSDDCPQICDEYAQKDKRIKVIHQENQGSAGARNTGLAHIQGELVTFVDADDWLDLHTMENYVKAWQQTGAGIVWGHIQQVRSMLPPKVSSKKEDRVSLLTAQDFVKELCVKGEFSVWNKLFSRQLIGTKRFQTKYTQGEDLVFWTTLLPDIKTVAHIDSVVYFYFQRASSLMHKADIQHHQYNQEFGQLLYETCQKCGFKQALPAALSVWLLSAALYAGYILLLDTKNQYLRQLQQVMSLFQKNRRFILTNHIMWQPARLLMQIWVLLPTFTKWFCRLPGINPLLRYWLVKNINTVR